MRTDPDKFCFAVLQFLINWLVCYRVHFGDMNGIIVTQASHLILLQRKIHNDVIKWKHFPRDWPFVRGITGPGDFPTQRPVTRSFDVFFDLGLNKRLSKQPWGWWFETPSWSLWRHCNADSKTAAWNIYGYLHIIRKFICQETCKRESFSVRASVCKSHSIERIGSTAF